jgi:hypothetical protein
VNVTTFDTSSISSVFELITMGLVALFLMLSSTVSAPIEPVKINPDMSAAYNKHGWNVRLLIK